MAANETDAAAVARLWNRYHKVIYALLAIAGAYLGASGWGTVTSGSKIKGLQAEQKTFLDSLRVLRSTLARRDTIIAGISTRVQFLLDERCTAILEDRTLNPEYRQFRAQCRRLSEVR